VLAPPLAVLSHPVGVRRMENCFTRNLTGLSSYFQFSVKITQLKTENCYAVRIAPGVPFSTTNEARVLIGSSGLVTALTMR
jgi:uncharacterized protein YcbX